MHTRLACFGNPFSNDYNNLEDFAGHHNTNPDFTTHVIMSRNTSGDVTLCTIVTGSKARAFEINPTYPFTVISLVMLCMLLASGISEKGVERRLQNHELLVEMLQDLVSSARSRDRPLVWSQL